MRRALPTGPGMRPASGTRDPSADSLSYPDHSSVGLGASGYAVQTHTRTGEHEPRGKPYLLSRVIKVTFEQVKKFSKFEERLTTSPRERNKTILLVTRDERRNAVVRYSTTQQVCTAHLVTRPRCWSWKKPRRANRPCDRARTACRRIGGIALPGCCVRAIPRTRRASCRVDKTPEIVRSETTATGRARVRALRAAHPRRPVYTPHR